MENVGAGVGIVIDDHAETIDYVAMSDDGTGGGIRIPSVLISKTDGDKLLGWFNKANETERNQLLMMAEFNAA